MSCYVDDTTTRLPSPAWPFHTSCHMTADTTAELVACARRLGLKDAWIQHAGRPTEHYDLTAGMRRKALAIGVIAENWRAAAMRIKTRERQP